MSYRAITAPQCSMGISCETTQSFMGPVLGSESCSRWFHSNAVVEAFWSTLKVELVQRHTWATRAMARQGVFEWVESFYNLQRLHSSLRYRAPAAYEAAVTGGASRAGAAA